MHETQGPQTWGAITRFLDFVCEFMYSTASALKSLKVGREVAIGITEKSAPNSQLYAVKLEDQ